MVRIMLPYIEHPAQAAKVAVYAGSFYPAWAFCQIVSIRFGEMYFRETVSRQTACLYDFCLTSTPFLKVKTMLPSAFTMAFSTSAFQGWDMKSFTDPVVRLRFYRKPARAHTAFYSGRTLPLCSSACFPTAH